MKKLFTIGLLALSVAQIANAKKIPGKPERTGRVFPGISQAAQKTTAVVSGTLFPESFGTGSACGSSIGVYRVDTDGYYAGVNVYGDKELLMRYALSEYTIGLPATVDTVKAFFGAKYVGSNGKVRAKVYSASSAGAPLNLLGTSGDISVSALDTTGKATNFVFTTPVNLSTATFFVSVDVSSLYASADTVGLFSTDDACTTTNPTDAWTKQADDKFYAFNDANNWNFSMDLAIFAHVNARTLAVGNVAANTIGAVAYPVPADNKLMISFTGRDNGNVSLVLKDITGKAVATANQLSATGGSYKVPFDVSTLSSGLYFVELTSGNTKSVLKVSVR